MNHREGIFIIAMEACRMLLFIIAFEALRFIIMGDL